jgi:hypothetical protein
MLFAIAYIYKLVVHQIYVKFVFLNDEEIYMEQPKGPVILGQEYKVYEMVKFLYVLKQAPKQWHEKFDKVMLPNLYLINDASKCIASFTIMNVSLFVFYTLMTFFFLTNIDIVHESRLFFAYNFDMKDIVKLMSCWTLRLIEIMIALFYLINIMLKRCLKDLSTFIIHLYLHHMIKKYT